MNSGSRELGKGFTQEQILQALPQNDTFSAVEIAGSIIQADGIKGEEKIEEARIQVENILRKLREEGRIDIVSDAGEEMRFVLVPGDK